MQREPTKLSGTLLGVSLDTCKFHKNDRVGATTRFSREDQNGVDAHLGLGISFRVSPCPYVSTFPIFPRTSVLGKVLIHVGNGKYREVLDLLDNRYARDELEFPLLEGTKDNEGHFSFASKSIHVARISVNNL